MSVQFAIGIVKLSSRFYAMPGFGSAIASNLEDS